MDKPRTYQKPKSNHPWRQYSNRKVETTLKVKKRSIKPFKLFITEIAESYDSMTIITSFLGREGEFKLSELPQERQASWLAGFLKRYYA